MKKIPLNRALSKLGVLSRAQATDAVLAGRVRVNGRLIRKPTTMVVPEQVRIDLDGGHARKAPWRTILFHKPRGVMTTRSDPEGRKTVYDVLGDESRGLIAVGRLDLATSGLLLLTSDTQLADWLTDPGRVTPADLESLHGHITLRKASNRESHLIVELREGKNREVRRMFDAIGHEVTSLKRVRFGGLELGTLAPGKFREVLHTEIAEAFPAVPLREVQSH